MTLQYSTDKVSIKERSLIWGLCLLQNLTETLTRKNSGASITHISLADVHFHHFIDSVKINYGFERYFEIHVSCYSHENQPISRRLYDVTYFDLFHGI